MSNESLSPLDPYPYYSEGMVLPPGVYPPMSGYTNADLVEAAWDEASKLLLSSAVDATLARETLDAMEKHVSAKFEEERTEYFIATYFKKNANNPVLQSENITAMAEEYALIASMAAADSLVGSPLIERGKPFFLEFCRRVEQGVRDRIMTLNKN